MTFTATPMHGAMYPAPHATPRGAPAISVAKRTQRVQWMQRVMTVLTSGPRFLSLTERFISVKRPRSLPNWNDCATQEQN